MRQRRQRLQVSTFPFLAVLLCAMGSLILLLVVIDRRAKVVARAKAMRAMQQALDKAAAEAEKAAAAHQKEWEHRRQILHAQLLQQEEQVLSELHTIEEKTAVVATRTQTDLARTRELEEQFQAGLTALSRLEEELNTQRSTVAQTAQQEDASRADLARLTAELVRMERTLADLQAARQRQQQMYSLVPYRGKRGDNRKPLYLECNGEELIFHPDHLALHGVMLTPSGIREEIERRLAQQPRNSLGERVELPQENAYLLMLIRPNGIPSYYRALAALKGLHIDFGYEFIDQDWLLDFSEESDTVKKQPWMMVDSAKPEQPSAPPIKGARPPAQSITGRPQGNYHGIVAGGTVPGQPGSSFAAGSTGPGNPWFGSPGFGAGRGAAADSRTVGNTTAGGQLMAASGGVGNGMRGTGNTNGPSFPEPDAPARTTVAGASGPRAEVSLGSPRSSGAGEIGRDGGPVTTRQSLGHGEPGFAAHGGMESSKVDPSLAIGQGTTPAPPSDNTMAQGAGTGQGRMQGSPENSGNQGIPAAPSPLPSFAPNQTGAQAPPGGDAPQGPAGNGVNPGGPAQGQPDSGAPAPVSASNPLDRLTTPNQSKRTVRATPLRSGLLMSNRDWIIPIECTADALVLYPSGQRIAAAELVKTDSGNNPLLETLQRLIARRQATVRPGEPPYRPSIRFRVHPDGLRCYYLAYPVLEALHVPMTRENVDPEEEKATNRAQ
jgi:hypothetical protein